MHVLKRSDKNIIKVIHTLNAMKTFKDRAWVILRNFG